MDDTLKILFVEDVITDAELNMREIEKNGITFKKLLVDNRKDFLKGLKFFCPDLIICDYSLPQFNGMSALLLRNELAPLIPFIIVTGALNEEIAVECMRMGADDYLIKDHLTRLPFAVKETIEKYRIQIKKRAAEEEIKNMKESLEMLNHHLEEIREEERALISREIHDQIGQSLTAIKMDIHWLSQKIASDSEEGAKLIGIGKLLDSTIKDIQRISSELLPAMLEHLGLDATIEWYCQEFQKRTGIKCHLKLEEIQFRDSKTNLVLYRILQEALTNVIRHSNAKKVTINLSPAGNHIILEVIDDGKGIEKEKISCYMSLGLIGMKERAKKYNGTVTISSGLNKGTKIRASIPL